MTSLKGFLLVIARLQVLACIALFVVMLAPASAHATLTKSATPEPTYLKGSTNYFTVAYDKIGTQNFHVMWTLNKYNENKVLQSQQNFDSGCLLGCSSSGGTYSPQSGSSTHSVNFTGLSAAQPWYGVCASEYHGVSTSLPALPNGITECWTFKAGATGTYGYFRVDQNAPEVDYVGIGGAADYANTSLLPVTLGYADQTSAPWPANELRITQSGYDSGWVTACNDTWTQMPANGWPWIYEFNCSVNANNVFGFGHALTDGVVSVQTRVRDQAFQDGLGASPTSASANVSAASLVASVTLDRVAPTLVIAASNSNVETGATVTFTASGTDATSGIAAASPDVWTWNLAGSGCVNPATGIALATATGTSLTCSFATVGTHTVGIAKRDRAGNLGAASASVTVTAPATPGGGTPTGTTGGTTPGGVSNPPAGNSTTTAAVVLKNTKKPTLSGRAKVGATLTCNKGTWTPTGVTFTYSWKRGAKAISKATARTYKLKAADKGMKVRCVVTAKKARATTKVVMSAQSAKVTSA